MLLERCCASFFAALAASNMLGALTISTHWRVAVSNKKRYILIDYRPLVYSSHLYCIKELAAIVKADVT